MRGGCKARRSPFEKAPRIGSIIFEARPDVCNRRNQPSALQLLQPLDGPYSGHHSTSRRV